MEINENKITEAYKAAVATFNDRLDRLEELRPDTVAESQFRFNPDRNNKRRLNLVRVYTEHFHMDAELPDFNKMEPAKEVKR